MPEPSRLSFSAATGRAPQRGGASRPRLSLRTSSVGSLDPPVDRANFPSMTATAKLVTRGRDQTIRLPKAFRFPGKTVQLRRTPEGVLISTERRDPEKLRRLFASLAGSCPDLPDVPPHTTPDVPRDFSL